MPKYTAKQSIGHFMPGDEIKGLEAKQLQALLTSGAIEEYQEPEEPKADGNAARLAELEKANAELTAANRTLTEANQTAATDKAKADGNAARLAELEKANAELTAANRTLTEANQTAVADKAKGDQEVADLKAKVAELEKVKPAAKPKAGEKPADETK